jgi:hypothetical protein
MVFVRNKENPDDLQDHVRVSASQRRRSQPFVFRAEKNKRNAFLFHFVARSFTVTL